MSDVILEAAVNELPTVAVREASRPVPRGRMAAYEERKAMGVGHFIDRELLAKDENRRLGDILTSNVPGLSIHRGTGSKSWAATGRTASSAKWAFCRTSRNEMLDPSDVAAGAARVLPDVYLDGAAVYSSSARSMALFNLTSIEANQVEAIEVYTGVGQIPTRG